MNTIFDDYLSTLDDSEKKAIVSALKNNDYARVEVLLRRPYSHEVVVSEEAQATERSEGTQSDREARKDPAGPENY